MRTKIKHRKPTGYIYDGAFSLKNSAKDMSKELNKMGYDTKIIKEDKTYFLYRKKR